jgi:L-lactate dehydrogenase complex protein LldG
VEEYRATVTSCQASAVADVITDICRRHGARRLVVPAGLPRAWQPRGTELVVDRPPLDVRELDRMDGVISGSRLGIAETGTIVLDGGAACGRRAISLVPDLHICVVQEVDLVATVPDGFDAVATAVADGSPVTLVSGPSATSDIELDRVEGVHGPRRLEVVLVEG